MHDRQIDRLLEPGNRSSYRGFRGVGGEIMACAAAFSNRRSEYYHAQRLLQSMTDGAKWLAERQNPNGLYDGGNLDSPPDTAFMIETLCKGQKLLLADAHEETEVIRSAVRDIILKAGEGLVIGGVHTPNHRWAVCSALAQINDLFPDQRYVRRIDEWLAEGIDVDHDGQWAERSPNYTADVNNPAMLHMAILLDRPELLHGVRRNLEMTVYHVEENGEVETVASRRQDQSQRARKYVWEYYIPYRYLAIIDNNALFAAMARRIEREFLSELGTRVTSMNSVLVYLLEFPEMLQPLPPGDTLPREYVKVFPETKMVRIKRNKITATIFSGSDWHAGFGVGSGLSTNPAFFKMRKGDVVLDSVRMTPHFFNTGFFFSEDLKVNEGTYTLRQETKVLYHLPMPEGERRVDGQYALTPDGRFFSKMAFSKRPKQFVTLTSEVAISENDGKFELAFNVSGYDNVRVTIELCFRAEGRLTGVELATSSRQSRERNARARSSNGSGTYFLKNGTGAYTVNDDALEFGPGLHMHTALGMEGEPYSVYNGSLRAVGDRVYITAVTPFQYVLTVK
jgi:hypothetical protein